MADSSTVRVPPTVSLAAGTRGRPRDWALIVLLIVCAIVVGWSYTRGDWGALIVAAGVGVGQLAVRWWWALESTPGNVRGYLVVPKSRWWQDRRCTVTFLSSSVIIRRVVGRDSWNVPWNAVDHIEVEHGRRCRLTLLVDGEALTEVHSVIHSDRLLSRLTAEGLPLKE